MTVAVDTTMQTIQYWGGEQDKLGYDTVWSMWEASDVNQQLLENKSYRVYYQFIREGATTEEIMNDEAWVEVSAFTAGGKVKDFWAAAESCFQQAKAQGDWHKFIEGFEVTENGYEMIMGS